MDRPWAETKLPVGHRIGLIFIAQAGTLSGISVLLFALYTAYKRKLEWSRILESHVHLYFFGLLFADFVQALGTISHIKWIISGHVNIGSYCTAQGIIQQLGEVAVALTSLAIGVDTFAVLFCGWQRPPTSSWIPILVLIFIWVFVALLVGVGYAVNRPPPNEAPYFGIAGDWCWITEGYMAQRIGLEYIFLWSCAFINILMYIPLYFKLRKGARKNEQTKEAHASRSSRPNAAKLAEKMLWYPLVYFVTVLPLSLTRWLTFSNPGLESFPATVFGGILFNLSGFFNVLLFTFTRRTLRPTTDTEAASTSSRPCPRCQSDDSNPHAPPHHDVHGSLPQASRNDESSIEEEKVQSGGPDVGELPRTVYNSEHAPRL